MRRTSRFSHVPLKDWTLFSLYLNVPLFCQLFFAQFLSGDFLFPLPKNFGSSSLFFRLLFQTHFFFLPSSVDPPRFFFPYHPLAGH